MLGLLTGLALERRRAVLAGTATLGSYTTFSTWMLETHRLAEDGEAARRCVNVAAQPRRSASAPPRSAARSERTL